MKSLQLIPYPLHLLNKEKYNVIRHEFEITFTTLKIVPIRKETITFFFNEFFNKILFFVSTEGFSVH